MELPPTTMSLLRQIHTQTPQHGPLLSQLRRDLLDHLGELQARLKRSEEQVALVNLELLEMRLERNEPGKSGPRRDSGDSHKENQYLQQLAYQDPITGLPNAALGKRHLRQQLAQVQSQRGSLALAVLDVQGLRELNLYLGRERTNQLLHSLALRIQSCLTDKDVLVRGQDDEFWVILSGVDGGSSGLKSLVTRARSCLVGIMENLEKPVVVEDQSTVVTLSCGLVTSQGQDRVSTLVERSQLSASLSRSTGRVTVWQPEMEKPIQQRRELVPQLKQALEEDRFVLRYQPIYKLATRQAQGLECLLRWDRPESGLTAPDGFLPAACQSGLVVPIGDWVMRQALALSKTYPDHYVCFNLSAQELLQGDFPKRFSRLLASSGARAERLVVEISELPLATANRRFLAILQELRRWNVQLAVDDFSFDHCSLRILERIQARFLKLGPELTKHIDRPLHQALLRAAVGVAESLNCRVIAEGVESESQCKLLLEHGCHWGQGLGLSPLIPEQDLMMTLRPL